MTEQDRLTHKPMDQWDLVRHHYNRRVQWGRDSILYRRTHPMLWANVEGTYRNWEVDTSDLVPQDANDPDGAPTKLFESEDLAIWFSRRSQSMPNFWRNCEADEVHLVTEGSLLYETDFGNITVDAGDFLVVPKGVTYRIQIMEPQDTVRLIYESVPEVFVVPTDMIDHIYHKGRPAVDDARLTYPTLPESTPPTGTFKVNVKYKGAFAEWMGDTSTLSYDFYPLDTAIVDGEQLVYKFNVKDIEKLGSTPVAFLGARYFDNPENVAWTLHLSGGGAGTAPVHRNPDADELRFIANGERMGTLLFTPQGVDHGAGRGYTKKDRNRPPNALDEAASISAYTRRPLKGTLEAKQLASPADA